MGFVLRAAVQDVPAIASSSTASVVAYVWINRAVDVPHLIVCFIHCLIGSCFHIFMFICSFFPHDPLFFLCRSVYCYFRFDSCCLVSFVFFVFVL